MFCVRRKTLKKIHSIIKIKFILNKIYLMFRLRNLFLLTGFELLDVVSSSDSRYRVRRVVAIYKIFKNEN